MIKKVTLNSAKSLILMQYFDTSALYEEIHSDSDNNDADEDIF
mgnify:CR=1 FL=1